jgi:hypothetical protein
LRGQKFLREKFAETKVNQQTLSKVYSCCAGGSTSARSGSAVKERARVNKKSFSYGKKKKFEAAYRPARDDVTARKSYLKSLLEEKIAIKYKVRDDLEDMNEENETLNPAIIIDDSSIITTSTNTTHSESLK